MSLLSEINLYKIKDIDNQVSIISLLGSKKDTLLLNKNEVESSAVIGDIVFLVKNDKDNNLKQNMANKKIKIELLQPTDNIRESTFSYLESLTIEEINNDDSRNIVDYIKDKDGNYSAKPADGTILTQAEYLGEPITITHNNSNLMAVTEELKVKLAYISEINAYEYLNELAVTIKLINRELKIYESEWILGIR